MSSFTVPPTHDPKPVVSLIPIIVMPSEWPEPPELSVVAAPSSGAWSWLVNAVKRMNRVIGISKVGDFTRE